ncbi:Hint domain-containing protein [Gloeothece verrucosa]|nr:Hint domain-containing protein [Gloeothece verrucosa]
MTTYSEYQEKFAQILKNSVLRSLQTFTCSSSVNLNPLINALIDSLPYYGDHDWNTAHKTALANLLAINLPNNSIAPHPDEQGPFYAYYRSTYYYNGSYSGYRDAFFHGISQSGSGEKVAALVEQVNRSLNGAWWGNYAVAVLTDAIKQKVSVSLDTSKLSQDLTNYNNSFKSALSASFLAVFETGYPPTSIAFRAIEATGEMKQASLVLYSAIADGQFTANINQGISTGGDSTNAATWFLFNLWIALKALGYDNVDAAITQYKNHGLKVPIEVDSRSWWTGGYISWYSPLSGADLIAEASATITAAMPEEELTVFSGSPYPATTNVNTPNGYSYSFSNWGSLNRYLPHSSSCFGKGTLVLMADGSAKPIESIQIGDKVLSNLGPRQVVLIEKPLRANRTLYSINNLNLFASSAHPFRGADQCGPMRYAIDPWALIDGIPTMTAKGVGKLEKNIQLLGIRNNQPTAIEVEQINSHPTTDENEIVYDLLLENWEKGYATYYVGGLETYFAVDAETADPLHDLGVTMAIVTAMEMLRPACWEHISEPHLEIPRILSAVNISDLPQLIRKAFRPFFGGKKKQRLSIPKQDFYMRNSEWDAHTSLLEYYLVREYGRWIRSELATGWRTDNALPSMTNHLAIGLFDLELIGDPIMANSEVLIELEVNGVQFMGSNMPHIITLPLQTKPVWNIRFDRIVNMGRVLTTSPSPMLIGRIKLNQKTFSHFRSAIPKNLQSTTRADHFIFNQDGNIIGRICLDYRQLSAKDLHNQTVAAEQWTQKHIMLMAISLGRQLGYKILAQIEAHSVK